MFSFKINGVAIPEAPNITVARPFTHNGKYVDYHLMWTSPVNLNETQIIHYVLMSKVKNTTVHKSLNEVIYETNINVTMVTMLAIDRCDREGKSSTKVLSTPSSSGILSAFSSQNIILLILFVLFVFML